MGQFLPRIENVFEEIRKYKVSLEKKLSLEKKVKDYTSDNPIKYQPKVKYSTKSK
jgi:hypothetical protein